LGYRHITGIKSWRLLEKARYIKKIKDDFYPNETPFNASREIAKMIGSRRDYALRILTGYALYEIIEDNGFYGIKGWDDTNFHFNYIADSLSRSNIEGFLGIDLESDNPASNVNFENLKEWTEWFFDKDRPNKIIGDSEHLNQLNKILDKRYPLALKAFRDGEELKIAFEYTDGIKEQFERAIENAIKYLEKADSLSHKQSEFKESLDDDLKNISGIIRKIKNIKDEIESDKLGI
jgi:Xaa-Pro aminopeptidase